MEVNGQFYVPAILSPREKMPVPILNRRLRGHLASLKVLKRKILFLLPEIDTGYLDGPACRLVTTLTEPFPCLAKINLNVILPPAINKKIRPYSFEW
jgi:hypothetical protein